MRRQSREVTRQCDTVLGELEILLQVLRIMEAPRFSSPPLCELRARLHVAGRLPSRQIARLARLAGYWETARRNQFVAPVAFLLMLTVHIAYAIERWRLSNAKSVASWLEAVGDFEALCSLSGYAYEHPQQPFPEIVDGGPRLVARGLGHPLIPASRRVANDVSLGTPTELLLVSGSNMSGKSTLLRSVGINAVLALAGAPVCAAQMQLSRLVLASAMRNVDSLQEGVSAFYAEIQRLRGIRDLAAGPTPVLFLLDEILHGTNSHDRRVGAEAVIANLLEQHAIGLITTHDLALAEIADRLEPRAANVHFEDQLVDGHITFDYRLRPGVVPKGNGLVLMRLLGFKV
jgi:DNA mismatch repair ATPase MutS